MDTDERFDGLLSGWLEESAPTRLPTRALDAAFDRTRGSRQERSWRRITRRIRVPVAVFAVGAVTVTVAAVTVMRPPVFRPSAGELPSTPASWTRIVMDAGAGAESVISLAAGPDRLLAIVRAGDGPARLLVSTDGERWTRIPEDHLPTTLVRGPFGSLAAGSGATIVGTHEGFLMVGDGIWASDDGSAWRSLASPADDPDLRTGRMRAVARGGPGYVAVGGDNRAWYSTDGSDWSLATTPPAPIEFFDRRGFAAPTVQMGGIAVTGDRLVAWGAASRHTADAGLVVPVVWASDDGRTWANVFDPEDSDDLAAIAVGPDGAFVAVGRSRDAATDDPRVLVRRSIDGRDWEPVASLDAGWSTAADGDRLGVSALAASSAGFAVAGERDHACLFDFESCQEGDVVLWTSADGRSWSRLADDGRFAGVPNDVVAWGERFVVGGASGGHPVVWVSDARPPSR
jgi:hypothetical protein